MSALQSTLKKVVFLLGFIFLVAGVMIAVFPRPFTTSIAIAVPVSMHQLGEDPDHPFTRQLSVPALEVVMAQVVTNLYLAQAGLVAPDRAGDIESFQQGIYRDVELEQLYDSPLLRISFRGSDAQMITDLANEFILVLRKKRDRMRMNHVGDVIESMEKKRSELEADPEVLREFESRLFQARELAEGMMKELNTVGHLQLDPSVTVVQAAEVPQRRDGLPLFPLVACLVVGALLVGAGGLLGLPRKR